MPRHFLEHEGRHIFVRGYAAVFGSLSVPLRQHGGQREIVRRGAFDSVLSDDSITCRFHHLDGDAFVIGSRRDGTLKIWSDDFGLAFQVGPLAHTGGNTALVSEILRNEARGCSWFASVKRLGCQNVGDERVRVITQFENLDHLSPVYRPAYPMSGIWLNFEGYYDMPDWLRPIVDEWHKQRALAREARRASTKTRAGRHGRASPVRRAPGGRCAGNGAGRLSDRELEDLARIEAHARKYLNEGSRLRP